MRKYRFLNYEMIQEDFGGAWDYQANQYVIMKMEEAKAAEFVLRIYQLLQKAAEFEGDEIEPVIKYVKLI